MNNIGERISVLIKELHITRLKFGKEVGLSSGAVSQICQGDKNPSTSTIKSICRTYGVREKWLVNGEGEIFEDTSELEELSEIMGATLSDECAPFRMKLLKIIATLPPEAINAIEAYARKMLEEDSDK